MCKSPKKLFKSAGKLLKKAAPAIIGFAVGGPAGAAIGAGLGSALSQPKVPKQQGDQQPVQAQAAQDPTQYLQEQTQANADAALANRRKRRGPGAATPSFLSAGANRGIITGGASLLGGGQ